MRTQGVVKEKDSAHHKNSLMILESDSMRSIRRDMQGKRDVKRLNKEKSKRLGLSTVYSVVICCFTPDC